MIHKCWARKERIFNRRNLTGCIVSRYKVAQRNHFHRIQNVADEEMCQAENLVALGPDRAIGLLRRIFWVLQTAVERELNVAHDSWDAYVLYGEQCSPNQLAEEEKSELTQLSERLESARYERAIYIRKRIWYTNETASTTNLKRTQTVDLQVRFLWDKTGILTTSRAASHRVNSEKIRQH